MSSLLFTLCTELVPAHQPSNERERKSKLKIQRKRNLPGKRSWKTQINIVYFLGRRQSTTSVWSGLSNRSDCSSIHPSIHLDRHKIVFLFKLHVARIIRLTQELDRVFSLDLPTLLKFFFLQRRLEEKNRYKQQYLAPAAMPCHATPCPPAPRSLLCVQPLLMRRFVSKKNE